jgi:glutaredoxin
MLDIARPRFTDAVSADIFYDAFSDGKTHERLEKMRKFLQRAKPPGPPRARVTIYSRPGCRLCDEAKACISSAGCDDDFTLEEVNIDEDPELKERFQFDIPVIFINGTKAFKHRVDPKEFKRKLRRIAG